MCIYIYKSQADIIQIFEVNDIDIRRDVFKTIQCVLF